MNSPAQYRVVAALPMSFILCAAAPRGLTLEANVPDRLADDLTKQTLAQAGNDGLTELESLGRPYALSWGAKVVGVLMQGRGTVARPDGHEKTCFVALVEAGCGKPSAVGQAFR